MVSIIVPVYNVEKYLDQCISSVLSQTYQDWELLLIDDGSTDNSKEICDQYSKTDSRIKAIHKVNGGVSSARNLGLENAQGEYLMFLDSDDFWLEDNNLKILVEKAESEDLDVVRGECVRVDAFGVKILANAVSTLEQQNKIIDSYSMVNDVMKGVYFSVLFILKKDAVSDLRFDESLIFGEDINFLIHLLIKELRCTYLPLQFYAYRQLESSASRTPNILNIKNSFGFCERYYECARLTEDERLSKLYIHYSIMMYYWTLEALASKEYIIYFRQLENELHLKDLRKTLNLRIAETGKNYPVHLYISPYWGIQLFHLRWLLGRILRKLRLRK